MDNLDNANHNPLNSKAFGRLSKLSKLVQIKLWTNEVVQIGSVDNFGHVDKLPDSPPIKNASCPRRKTANLDSLIYKVLKNQWVRWVVQIVQSCPN